MFLGIDWGKFVTLSFWTSSNPGSLSRSFEIIFLVIVIIGYGLALVSYILEKKYFDAKNGIVGDFWRIVNKMMIYLSVCFTFLFFLRVEGVPYLGGRYMFAIWAIAGIAWLAKLLLYYYRGIPMKKLEWEKPKTQQPLDSRYIK